MEPRRWRNRSPRRPIGIAVALVAAAALLAGCGSSTSSARPTSYVQKVDAVAGGLSSVTNDLSTPSDVTSAAAELVTVRAALRKAAAQLAAITPPARIKAQHRRLVEAMNELAAGVGPLIAKLKSGDMEGASAAFAVKAATEARAAIAAINAAGYGIAFPLLS